MIAIMFRDRTQSGAALAAAAPELRRKSNTIVIGLARGGVEVAAEMSRLLDLPLDVMCVRKVPMPGYPELAMGAVAPMGERFTNRRVASLLSREQLDEAYDKATAEARAMDERLRGGLPMMLIGRTAVLVDDGAATGASIRAAMAARIDAPVAAPSSTSTAVRPISIIGKPPRSRSSIARASAVALS